MPVQRFIYGCFRSQSRLFCAPLARHITDKAEGYEVFYPKDFEEIYHIVHGSGIIQWKTEDGKIKEEKVAAGDTIFLPVDVAEHQLLNNSTEKMFVVFCGNPTPKVTLTDK
jgi:oxalate decarboxylase/phosphoglucose isomerase-like protein (cupin superfamily)